MSRRYGRKQKRAARAQIAELEKGSIQLHEMFIWEAKRRRAFSDKCDDLLGLILTWDGEMRALLGRHTALAISPETMMLKENQRLDRMPIHPPLPRAVFSADTMVSDIEYHIANIFHVVAGLGEDDLERLRRFIFLKVEREGYREAEVRHAVSEEYWRDMWARGEDGRNRLQRLVTEILPQLTAMITRDPAKRKRA